MYNLSQFRQNLRQAFNDAEQGHEVLIERYGHKYQLVALTDKPLPGHAFSSSPKKSVADNPNVSFGRQGRVDTITETMPDPIYVPDSQDPGDPQKNSQPRSGLEPLYRNKKKGKI